MMVGGSGKRRSQTKRCIPACLESAGGKRSQLAAIGCGKLGNAGWSSLAYLRTSLPDASRISMVTVPAGTEGK